MTTFVYIFLVVFLLSHHVMKDFPFLKFKDTIAQSDKKRNLGKELKKGRIDIFGV